MNIFRILRTARYTFAFMGCMCMALINALKVNLNIALVGMLNHSAHHLHDNENPNISITKWDQQLVYENPYYIFIGKIALHMDATCGYNLTGDLSHVNEDGPFLWSESLQAYMHSAYFWCYIFFQIPSSRLAETYSAKWVIAYGCAINIVTTLLLPASCHFLEGWGVLSIRMLQGAGSGAIIPALHVLLAQWSPPVERSILNSIVYAGMGLGLGVSFLVSGEITRTIGWYWVFYIQGLIAAVWLFFWIYLVADDPYSHKTITEKEKFYIVHSFQKETFHYTSETEMHVPWHEILTSKPLLAIVVANTCAAWGWYIIITEMPLYLKRLLDFNLHQNSWLMSIPFFMFSVLSVAYGLFIDSLRGLGKIRTTAARKLSTLISSIVPASGFFLMSFVVCERGPFTVAMWLSITAMATANSGYLANPIDIAPNFAGTVMAVSETVTVIPGIMVPIVVGLLSTAYEHEKAWKIIFGMTSSFYIIEAIMYLFYGTAKEQRWNKPEHYDRPRLSLAEIFETADTHSIYHLPRRLQKEMTTQARQH